MALKIMGGVGLRKIKQSQYSGKKRKYNKAVELIDVVPGLNNQGYIIAKPLHVFAPFKTDAQFHVKINQENYDKNEARPKAMDASFYGHKIDEKMRTAFLEEKFKKQGANKKWKNIIVLENLEFKTTIKENGESINVYECSYIHNIQAKPDNKYRVALISASGYFKDGSYRCSHYLDWGENPQAINLPLKKDGEFVDLESVKEISELKKQFQKSYENAHNKDNSTTPMGVKIDAIIPNPNYDPNVFENSHQYTAIYTTEAFDWDKNLKDHMDGERFIETITTARNDLYDAYHEEYPNMEVEISVYNVMPASPKSRHNTVLPTQTGSPIYQMITTNTGYSTEVDYEEGVPNVWGGFAFLDIPRDRSIVVEDEETGEQKIVSQKMNFINRAYMDGSIYNIRTKIKTSHGTTCGIHPNMKAVSPEVSSVNTLSEEDHQNMNSHVEFEDEVETEQPVTKQQTGKTVDTVVAAQVDDVDDDIPF